MTNTPQRFMIYTTDHAQSGHIRADNRDAHLQHLKAPGRVRVLAAGPWLDDDGQTMRGSLLIVEAKCINCINDWLKEDPYVVNGLTKSAKIHPFTWAIGAPDIVSN